jgi:arylsulfatase
MAIRFLVVVVVFAGVAVAFVRPRPVIPSRVGKAPENAPNVIEIVVDTLGGKYLRPSELHRYPGFAGLAHDGFHFERAYSTASHTGYSVPAIITSNFEWLGGHQEVGDYGQLSVAVEDRTVGKMKAAGYETVGFSANVVVSANFGYDRGFDYFSGGEGTSLLGAGLLKAIGTTVPRFAYRFGLADGGTFHENMETLYAKIVSYVSRPRREGTPFYMYVQTMDMHGPYMPPTQYMDGDFRYEDFFSPYLEKGGEQGVGEVPDAFKRNALQQYLGGLRYTDHYVGLLVQKLKELGIYDDTLIIITADHGEEFWEHGRIGHNRDDRSLHEEMIRIPLFIKPPRSLQVPQRGVTVPLAVSSLDIHPTILDFAGVDPGAVRGRSLRPLMLGTNDHFEARVLQGVGACGDGRMFYAIRDNWKLVWYERTGRTELYDLRADPQESTNLFSPGHVVAQTLLPDLTRLSAAYSRPSESQKADLPLQLKSQLRALGYIE